MRDAVGLPSAPAAERNFLPILGVLEQEFAGRERVLEIGSGTGQHAAGFAKQLNRLTWQPSDVRSALGRIQQWVDAADLPNLESPVALDVGSDSPPAGRSYDAVFSANTAHIMDEANVGNMFRVAALALHSAGRFCLYGPFREHGEFSTESNRRFDAGLREQDPKMGIRDIERLDEFASRAGLQRVRRYAMPGNNLVLVYDRR